VTGQRVTALSERGYPVVGGRRTRVPLDAFGGLFLRFRLKRDATAETNRAIAMRKVFAIATAETNRAIPCYSVATGVQWFACSWSLRGQVRPIPSSDLIYQQLSISYSVPAARQRTCACLAMNTYAVKAALRTTEQHTACRLGYVDDNKSPLSTSIESHLSG